MPPDSCHSPSQCTIMDPDTHRLPHQNAAAVEHTLSHLHKICPTEREKVGRKGVGGQQPKSPKTLCLLTANSEAVFISLTFHINLSERLLIVCSGNRKRLLLSSENKSVTKEPYLSPETLKDGCLYSIWKSLPENTSDKLHLTHWDDFFFCGAHAW